MSSLPSYLVIMHQRPFPVAFVAPPTGTDVIYFPVSMDTGSTDVGSGPVRTGFGQLNVGSVTVCQFWANTLRGIVCFYTLPCVSTITTRQARPREPGLKTHRADPNPVLRPGARHSWAQIRSSEPCQLLDQWMRTINICYEPSRLGFYLLK